MATINLNELTIHTSGNLPQTGTIAPNFKLVAGDLSRKTLTDFSGSRLVLNIFPSIDTGTCAASVRKFNEEASNLENTKILCISRDLPFAQGRFCGAEGIKNVEMLSDFAAGKFGKDYQLEFADGPFKNLHSRAIIIIDPEGIVKYTEQVHEIADEPNYSSAINAI